MRAFFLQHIIQYVKKYKKKVYQAIAAKNPYHTFDV